MRGAAQVRSRRAKGGHKHTGGERETTVMDQRRGRGFHLFDRVFGEQRVELSPLSDRLRTVAHGNREYRKHAGCGAEPRGRFFSYVLRILKGHLGFITLRLGCGGGSFAKYRL